MKYKLTKIPTKKMVITHELINAIAKNHMTNAIRIVVFTTKLYPYKTKISTEQIDMSVPCENCNQPIPLTYSQIVSLLTYKSIDGPKTQDSTARIRLSRKPSSPKLPNIVYHGIPINVYATEWEIMLPDYNRCGIFAATEEQAINIGIDKIRNMYLTMTNAEIMEECGVLAWKHDNWRKGIVVPLKENK